MHQCLHHCRPLTFDSFKCAYVSVCYQQEITNYLKLRYHDWVATFTFFQLGQLPQYCSLATHTWFLKIKILIKIDRFLSQPPFFFGGGRGAWSWGGDWEMVMLGLVTFGRDLCSFKYHEPCLRKQDKSRLLQYINLYYEKWITDSWLRKAS